MYFAIKLFTARFHLSALVMIQVYFFILQIKIEPLILGAYVAVSALLLIFSGDCSQGEQVQHAWQCFCMHRYDACIRFLAV